MYIIETLPALALPSSEQTIARRPSCHYICRRRIVKSPGPSANLTGFPGPDFPDEPQPPDPKGSALSCVAEGCLLTELEIAIAFSFCLKDSGSGLSRPGPLRRGVQRPIHLVHVG